MNSGQRIPHIGLLASAVLTAVSTIAFTVPATTQAATLLGAACGFGPSPHLSGETGHTAANGVNLRSGTSINCQPPVATINPSDLLSYQCWTEEQDGTWTYLQDGNIGKWGYIRNDLLTNGGSHVKCGF